MVDAISVFSPDSIRHLLVEMPEIFTGFHPLGYVLVVMLGAGVADARRAVAAAADRRVDRRGRVLVGGRRGREAARGGGRDGDQRGDAGGRREDPTGRARRQEVGRAHGPTIRSR